jgi:RHS repeat-associated protein
VWEHSGLVEERIYLGGWEVYRKRDSFGNLLLEWETLHGMDGARRVVLVETKTVDVDAVGVFTPVSRVRFQLDNHLGSASLEVDESGLVIGYEEYHPYGTTAYASGRSGAEVSGKRYRYTGKERDEETGLYYHGARHMAPWLGRWIAADPSGMTDGPGLYVYVRNNPVQFVDPNGREATSSRFTDAQLAALTIPVHIPKGARVGWLNQTHHKAGTYINGGERNTAGGAPGVGRHVNVPGSPPAAPSGGGGSSQVLGSSLPALRGGGTGGDHAGGEGGEHRTDLDKATVVAALFNLVMGDDRGVSGGIPGGMGSAENASTGLQALYVAITANQVAGMALDITKALWSLGKSALKTITGRLAGDRILRGALQESASAATSAAGSGLAVPEKIAADALVNSADGKVAPAGPRTLYHYTDRPESDFSKKFWSGSSVTDNPDLTAVEAVETLGLKRPPDKVIPIVDRGHFIENRPFIVQEHPLGPGGGTDFTNPRAVPPTDILPARPIRR